MSNQPVIKLHNTKDTEFEFNVAIQGMTNESAPVVRFVVENVKGYNVAINAERSADGNWAVKVPALQSLEENTNFHVEVIVDGYYFVPTTGLVEVVKPSQTSIRDSFAKHSPVVESNAPQKVVKYYDLTEAEQDILHTKTKQVGMLLTKAGQMMEAGFDSSGTKPLDTATLNKALNLVKEGVDSLKAKLLG